MTMKDNKFRDNYFQFLITKYISRHESHSLQIDTSTTTLKTHAMQCKKQSFPQHLLIKKNMEKGKHPIKTVLLQSFSFCISEGQSQKDIKNKIIITI